MAAILRDRPASTEGDLDVVPGFGRLVHRMLAKACAERFQTMRDVRAELDGLRESSGARTPRGSGASGTAPLQVERTAFVARETELAELMTHLDRMLLGQGGLVLLGGEPGVGKTRLARELQRAARERGCVVITGQCYEQEGAPPFGPFVETMEQAVRLVPEALRAAIGDVAAELAMMAPALRRVFADIPPLPEIPPEQRRPVLFNAYLTYLQRASSKSAAVVLFDDLHWADDSSVQLLLHLAPHLSSMRLLVVGTYRDVDLDAKRPFAKGLEMLLRQRLATRVHVKRLNASGVERLLTSMSGAPAPASFVRAVFDETEGNPFFVEELFQHLREEDRLFEADGRWRMDLRVEDIDVPEGVRLVVSRRLERLGESARKMLTAAAVIGRSFPLAIVEAVAGLSEDVALDAIEEAERAQLIHAERGREARYTFVHEIIRSTLLADLSLPRRQRLHVRIADALESRRPGAPDGLTVALAHHLYQAGTAVDQNRAISAIMRALAQARAAGAFEDALTLAEQLLSFDLAPDSGDLAVVEETQVDALFGLGRIAEALRISEQYLAHSMERRDEACTAAAALRVARTSAWLGRGDETLDRLQRALAAIPSTMERTRAEALTAYATALANLGRVDEAEDVLTETLAVAQRTDARACTGYALLMRAYIRGWQGRFVESLEAAEAALVALADTKEVVVGSAAMQRVGMLVFCGRVAEADTYLPTALGLTRRSGVPIARWAIESMSAVLTVLRTGLFAVDHFLDAPPPARGVPSMESLLAVNCASSELCQGRIEEAARYLTEVRPQPYFVPTVEASLMLVYAWGNREDDVRASWQKIAPVTVSAGVDASAWTGANALVPAALALSLIGADAECASLYPALEQLPARGHVYPLWYVWPSSPQLAIAASAEACGLRDVAWTHYVEALRLADALPDRLGQPVIKMWMGRYLSRRGGDWLSQGVALLHEAASAFDRLGMPLHRERARQWLNAFV
jgi:tetratricopeptide (TPR) repeat protein